METTELSGVAGWPMERVKMDDTQKDAMASVGIISRPTVGTIHFLWMFFAFSLFFLLPPRVRPRRRRRRRRPHSPRTAVRIEDTAIRFKEYFSLSSSLPEPNRRS